MTFKKQKVGDLLYWHNTVDEYIGMIMSFRKQEQKDDAHVEVRWKKIGDDEYDRMTVYHPPYLEKYYLALERLQESLTKEDASASVFL